MDGRLGLDALCHEETELERGDQSQAAQGQPQEMAFLSFKGTLQPKAFITITHQNCQSFEVVSFGLQGQWKSKDITSQRTRKSQWTPQEWTKPGRDTFRHLRS